MIASKIQSNILGVLALAFSFSSANVRRGSMAGGSTFFTGAFLLPGKILVLSGELYMPNTSARASLVLIVTVGSAPPIRLFFRAQGFAIFDASSSKSSCAAERGISDGEGGPHFLPRRPIERARAS
jgi:hypothetical protein